MLLNILRCARQPLTIKNYRAQNFNSAKVEKPWATFILHHFPPGSLCPSHSCLLLISCGCHAPSWPQVLCIGYLYPLHGIAGAYDNSIFNFLRNHHTVSHKQLYYFTFPPTVHKSSNSSTSSPTFAIIYIYIYIYVYMYMYMYFFLVVIFMSHLNYGTNRSQSSIFIDPHLFILIT